MITNYCNLSQTDLGDYSVKKKLKWSVKKDLVFESRPRRDEFNSFSGMETFLAYRIQSWTFGSFVSRQKNGEKKS